MKRAILIAAALLMVVSGVAAVSAYEAHLINVTAHVENALEVDTDAMEFGTVFPEEWITMHRLIELSDSAVAEKGTESGDLNYVEIQCFAEWKPVPANTTVDPVVVGTDSLDYYSWLGNCLYVGFNPTGPGTTGYTLVGPPDPVDNPVPPGAQEILGTYQLDGIISVSLYAGIDVPVFEGYYNVHTDPTPKPSGLMVPTWIIPEFMPDGTTPNPLWDKDGIDLGIDLKVQVIDIVRN